MSTQYISYLRTSTRDQHNGISAQRTSVKNFLKEGDNIVKEFVEHESGRNTEREQLWLAIEECKNHGYTLLVARFCRLSRNAEFTLSLLNSKVNFTSVDMPEANHLTIGIISLLNEEEAKRISKNTKASLKVVSERLAKEGKKLGTPANLKQEHRVYGAYIQKQRAIKKNHQVTKIITRLRQDGVTYEAIADELNNDGYTTSVGGKFSKSTVRRLYKRVA